MIQELERARGGAWLPQALPARQRTLREALAQLERQQARLLDVYLAEVIGHEEFQRKRRDLTQTQESLTRQMRQLEVQAQQHIDLTALAQGIDAFCQGIAPTLDQLNFAQRRQLVELLIDRVIVSDGQVEIRYVVPTGPKGETTPFCHLRSDYLDRPPQSAEPHKGAQGYTCRGITDRIRVRGGRAHCPLDHQPDTPLWQPFLTPRDPLASKRRLDGTFCPLRACPPIPT